jgi:hypothetical protein
MSQNKHLTSFFYIGAVGISIGMLFFVVVSTIITYEVKMQCVDAKAEYGRDCVDAQISLLEDENRSFRSRNSAIWVLGQLGESRALPALEKYYTGSIPVKESLDRGISQYELKKAINLAKGGLNLIAWARDKE